MTHMKQLKERCFSHRMLSAKEIDFIRLCTSQDTTPELLRAYFETIDFEKLNGQHVCALVEFARQMQYQGVPKELLPRVRGVLRYYTALNTKQFQEFYQLLKLCNENQVDVMLMKGGAMKAYYMPRAIRYMGDIDFWVKQEDFDKVCQLAEKTGKYQSFGKYYHVILYTNKQSLEIHSRFLKENQMEVNEDIFWEDARKTTLQGEDVYVPSPEAMLLLILTHIFQDSLGQNVLKQTWMRWIFDVVWLIDQNEVDWEKMQSLCQTYHTTLAVKTMLLILNEIIPGKIEKCVLEGFQIDEETDRRIPLMLRMSKAHETFMARRNTPNLTYVWNVFLVHWYQHRWMGNRSSVWADLLAFPTYVKGIWRCKTWREWWKKLYRKIRNPKYGDVTS